MIQAPTKNKTGFHIGVTCPGCGAKLEMQEDFFVLGCDFCGSVLRIDMPEIPPAYLIKSSLSVHEIRFQIDRFLKKNRQPLTRSILETEAIYYPYWKIDAIILKVRNRKIQKYMHTDSETREQVTVEQHLTDINLSPFCSTSSAGINHDIIPHSLGMRSEYIKLWAFSEENIDDSFSVFPVQIDWKKAIADLDKTIFALDKLNQADFGKNLTEYFHPQGAIVYFPYFIARAKEQSASYEFLVDGVSGRVLNQSDKPILDESALDSQESNIQFGELQIDLHRCATCGWDLPEEQSAVYVCKNCNELTIMEKSKFKIEHLYRADSKLCNDDMLFPFWSFKISESDSKKLKQMFGGIYDSDRLVIPAFRLQNFESIYRLTKRISSALPNINLTPVENLSEKYINIGLPLSEALTMAEILICREEVARGKRNNITQTEFAPQDLSLFYAPFHKESYFYVDSIFNAITFEKAQF